MVIVKGFVKLESGKVILVNVIDVNVKLLFNLFKVGIVKRDSYVSEVDIFKNDKIEKEIRINNKYEFIKVDFGT